AEQAGKKFPSPDEPEADRIKKLDAILAENPKFVRAFLYDPKQGIIVRSQPDMMDEKWFRDEHTMTVHAYTTWFGVEGKYLCEQMAKKEKPVVWWTGYTARGGSQQFMTSAFFLLPNVARDRNIFGGVTLDPDYLKSHFFPNVLDEVIEH